MSTCKACGEEILWLRTRAGKRMPVDPETFGQHQLEHGVTVVTPDGTVLRGGSSIASAAYGYAPHWATCTHPEQFRGSR